MSPEYVYDQAWELEHQRLQGLETLYDPFTRETLQGTGVGAGWSCLEVGFGAGSIARWLTETVGPTGHVLATDLDPRFAPSDLDGLEVRQHDLVTDSLEQDAYDLVHARMVLEHIGARDDVLPKLAAAVKPGGWLVVEDVHLGGPMTSALSHYVADPELAAIYDKVMGGFETFMGAAGVDVAYGARLPSAFTSLGLINVSAVTRSRSQGPGEDDFARLSTQHLRAPMLGAGLVTEDEFETFLASYAEPGVVSMTMFLVSASGQRPI